MSDALETTGGARRSRKPTRSRQIDYTAPNAYFVTVCVADRACLLGEIDASGVFHESAAGAQVERALRALPDRFEGVSLDSWTVMPNHVHAIIVLSDVHPVGAGLAPPEGSTDTPMMPRDSGLGGASPAPTSLHAPSSYGTQLPTVPVGAGLAPPEGSTDTPMMPRDSSLGEASLAPTSLHAPSPDGTQLPTVPVGAGLAPPEGSTDTPMMPRDSGLGGASPAPTSLHAPSSDGAHAPRPRTRDLSSIVGAFKSLSARAVGGPLWQRSFYDHVVRDTHDLARIRRYIEENALRWALDPLNPLAATSPTT
jgi:REP element-mobilizing transposase RayT